MVGTRPSRAPCARSAIDPDRTSARVCRTFTGPPLDGLCPPAPEPASEPTPGPTSGPAPEPTTGPTTDLTTGPTAGSTTAPAPEPTAASRCRLLRTEHVQQRLGPLRAQP